jgi:hypothetical protein
MRSLLGAFAVLLAFATSPQQEAEARAAEGTFCMECESHYFYAYFGDEGHWWLGERCAPSDAYYGFSICVEDYYPGNIQFGEIPSWTCRAQEFTREDCEGRGYSGGGGGSGELQLTAHELGLDGRVAVDPRRLDISADVIEIRNCDQWLLWTAATTTD